MTGLEFEVRLKFFRVVLHDISLKKLGLFLNIIYRF